MIPDNVPVNTWAGNGSSTIFDFDFLINNDSELLVEHSVGEEKPVTLELNKDYKINTELKNANGGNITFPISGSKYSVLGKGEKITLSLKIPIAQSTPYGTSAKLNLKSIELSFDYVTRLIQILSRKVDRSVKVQEGSSVNTDQLRQDLIIVADNITDINTIAANISDVNIVVDKISSVCTVSDSIENVNAVGNNIEIVVAVDNNKGNIDAVADNKTNIDICANNITDINNAKNNANTAMQQANIATNKAQETSQIASKAQMDINNTKTSALSAIGQDNNSGARGSAIAAINNQRQQSVLAVSSVGNDAINTISKMQSDINQSKENAKDFYQKAVGWNIQYETDGEEDCLVFEDRTEAEINQAKNYIEDTRDKAITTIQNKTTEGINNISATEDSVVNSVKTQGEKSVENITIAKNQAVTEVRNASATNINTATSNGLNEITEAKNSAVLACSEQVALAKEYAQQANGWDFSYQDETLVFTRNEV